MEFRRVLFRSRRPFASFLSERRSPHIEWQFRRIWQGVSRLRRTRRGNPRDPRLESRDGNASLAKVAKKGCADNGLQYREILLLSCYQRPPLDPALLPPSQRLRSEEHTSELKSLMRSSYAVCSLQKKKHIPSTY